MTHQNHQTNGASLEDCHTNFFALTDLCGIKWRKFVNGERHNASADPLDDPILRSYSRCMQADMLCVWRRVQSTKQDQPDPNNTMSFEICTSRIHPPLSFAASKELWIFWYGEEPDLNGLVDSELLRISANQPNYNGTWENGLTYECRSLLFKALHNLMERFVLTKDIVRFGKWFVQPCTTNDRIFGKSSQHLSFSFTFFVHGDTVCASIDLREHPAVRQITAEHLADAAAASTAAQAGQQDVRQRSVILAPFGMAATLTGNSYKATDPIAEKILEDWVSFFPLCNKENSDLPPVVEVVSGGHKMYHPTMYVLVTDLDDMETVLEETSTDQSQGILSSIGLGPATAASSTTNPRATPINNISPPTPSACGLVPVSKATPTAAGGLASTQASPLPISAQGGATSTNNNTTGVTTQQQHQTEANKANVKKFDNKTQPFYATSRNNTHAPPQASTEMPERVWQDCITNPISSLSLNSNSNSCDGIKLEAPDNVGGSGGGGDGSLSNNNNNNNTNSTSSSTDTKTLWNFVDPSQKAQ